MIDEILQSSADAQILSGADGRIRVANSQAERLFGYGPGELDGKPIEILIPGDFRERHRALIYTGAGRTAARSGRRSP